MECIVKRSKSLDGLSIHRSNSSLVRMDPDRSVDLFTDKDILHTNSLSIFFPFLFVGEFNYRIVKQI